MFIVFQSVLYGFIVFHSLLMCLKKLCIVAYGFTLFHSV